MTDEQTAKLAFARELLALATGVGLTVQGKADAEVVEGLATIELHWRQRGMGHVSDAIADALARIELAHRGAEAPN